MDRSVLWRSAVLQAASLTVLALILAAALPRSFFVDWGWLAGPGVWAACALLVASLLSLPALGVLVGAALAGLPALLGVATGAHWLGVVLGVPLFALWCARLAHVRGLAAGVV